MKPETIRPERRYNPGAQESGRTLVLIVAFNAESTIQNVLERVPVAHLGAGVEVVIVDDSSRDRTFEIGLRVERTGTLPLNILRTPVSQGYGGSQKLGFQYAIDRGFDRVALLHGDGKYAPETLPELLAPLVQGDADAVLGSRMKRGWKPLRSGMPLHKYAVNKLLTRLQNLALGVRLTDWHCGFRAYSIDALKAIPFQYNTNDWHFDTELTIQLVIHGWRIREFPIPAYAGEEIRRLRGVRYAWSALATTAVSQLQDLGVLYRRKYARPVGESPYSLKLGFPSSHSFAAEAIGPEEAVLDLGCGVGYVAEALRGLRGCRVTGVDRVPASTTAVRTRTTRYLEHDLADGTLPEGLDADYQTILLLDVVEHLRKPERLLENIRRMFAEAQPRVILTTPNIAFITIRIGLLVGSFNYGPRGILDLTHTRLFTFRTLRQLLEECGFEVRRIRGIPAPFPLALGDRPIARFLQRVNSGLLAILPSLFSYQIYIEAIMAPTVEELVARTIADSDRVKRERRAQD